MFKFAVTVLFVFLTTISAQSQNCSEAFSESSKLIPTYEVFLKHLKEVPPSQIENPVELLQAIELAFQVNQNSFLKVSSWLPIKYSKALEIVVESTSNQRLKKIQKINQSKLSPSEKKEILRLVKLFNVQIPMKVSAESFKRLDLDIEILLNAYEEGHLLFTKTLKEIEDKDTYNKLQLEAKTNLLLDTLSELNTLKDLIFVAVMHQGISGTKLYEELIRAMRIVTPGIKSRDIKVIRPKL